MNPGTKEIRGSKDKRFRTKRKSKRWVRFWGRILVGFGCGVQHEQANLDSLETPLSISSIHGVLGAGIRKSTEFRGFHRRKYSKGFRRTQEVCFVWATFWLLRDLAVFVYFWVLAVSHCLFSGSCCVCLFLGSRGVCLFFGCVYFQRMKAAGVLGGGLLETDSLQRPSIKH